MVSQTWPWPFHSSLHNHNHYGDVTMSAMASQITSLTIVYSIVYSDADQRKHQSSASLAFVLGIHRSPVNSPHKWPVARKMSLFDDVIMMVGNLPVVRAMQGTVINLCKATEKAAMHCTLPKIHCIYASHISGDISHGLYSLGRQRFIGIGFPIINLRRPSDRLRFIMGIPISAKRRHFSD